MDVVPFVLAGVGGIFLGMLVTARVLSWIQAMVEARKAAVSKESSSRTALVVVVLLHSGPWLLGITFFGAYYALTRNDGEGWVWFFSGIVVAPLVLIPTAILISRRNEKLRQRGSANAA